MCSGGFTLAGRRGERADRDDAFPGFGDVVEIASGSVATVFRARDLNARRPVALKVLHAHGSEEAATAAFDSEAAALGELSSHPHILTLHAVHRTPAGDPVLVLELCRGSMAAEISPGHPLPVADAVDVGAKIAGALETAHRAGLLHRDVRPGNVLITDYGEPVLSGFGLAALQAGSPSARLAGAAHVAPELLEGESAAAATDVYSLASTLYELITGRPPLPAYEGESAAATALRILRDPVPLIVSAHVPTALSDLLVTGMEKHPGDRPASAVEFAAALAAVAEEQGWPRGGFVVRDPADRTATTRAPALTSTPGPIPNPGPFRTDAVGETPGDPSRAAVSPSPVAGGDVPVWASRADALPPGTDPTDGPGAQDPDLRIEPSTLRRRVTLRSGARSLTVDESGLAMRGLLRRREIEWVDVRRFESRSAGGAAGPGRLVAITSDGVVELPATHRAGAELRHVHALLDAYLSRARAAAVTDG